MLQLQTSKRWWFGLVVVTVLVITLAFHKPTHIVFSPKIVFNAPSLETSANDTTIQRNFSYSPAKPVRQNNTDGHRRHRHTSLYSTILQPNTTCSSNTFLYIAVVSKPSNQIHRKVYRETVLSPVTKQCLPDVKYVFVVGRTDNQELQDRLEKESLVFGDILQGNFTDSYENLTIKSLYLVQWAKLHCPQAKYLMKLDDDVFTILKDVRDYLKSNPIHKYSIAGSVFKKVRPIRDHKNKWYVDVGDFPEQFYPTYVSGTAYIISYDLLQSLIVSAFNTNFVRLEDVFISGISAQATKLPVKYYQIPGFQYAQNSGLNLGRVSFRTSKSIHGVSDKELSLLYMKLKKERPHDCV